MRQALHPAAPVEERIDSIGQFAASRAALSPAAGYAAAGKLQPFGIAVDASGNLWVANYGSDSLTKFLGIVAPVATPRMDPPRAPQSPET